MMFRWNEKFTYALCANCDSLYIIDCPDDLGKYYPDFYYSVKNDPREVFSGRLQRAVATSLAKRASKHQRLPLLMVRAMSPIKELRTFATSLLAYASAGVPLKRLLDVGSGNGIVAYALSLGGAEISVGIDPFCSNEIVDGNFSLLQQGIDGVTDKWDLVTFHHSLEHVPNPREQVKCAAGLLNENGRIVVRIPTIDCEAWRIYGRKWFQLDPPRHLFIPSRKGLVQLAEQAGLEIVRSYDDSSSAQFWLSEHISIGEAMTTTESGNRAFAKPKKNPFNLMRNVIKTIRVNKASRGDQICVVLARVN